MRQTDTLREVAIFGAKGQIDDTIKTVVVMPTYKQNEKVIDLIKSLVAL